DLCQYRGQQEKSGEDQAGDQHGPLQSHALGHVGNNGEAPQQGFPAGVEGVCAHGQYPPRGSIRAATTSTTKFVAATITARSTTMPWTATKSRALRYWTNW